MSIKEVTLLLTKRCNLRCNYCYVRYDSNKTMSLEMARQILLNELSIEDETTKIVISFMGGEPFLEFERLKEICEWIWSRHWDTQYFINIVSNGTLITQEIRSWLVKNYERLYLTLSYDGTSNTQNLNRSNSASKIDIDFFHEYWPEIPVKMTITEDSVSSLFDDTIFLHQKGMLVNDTFADNTLMWKNESLMTLDKQFANLCAYYLEHPEIKSSDLLSVDLVPILSSEPRKLFDCGAGKDKIVYDIDGMSYQCHLLSPLALSRTQLEMLEKDIQTQKTDFKCSSCILDKICPFCPGMSFLSKHTCWIREDKTCSIFNLQIRYACAFQLKRILMKKAQGGFLNNHDKLTYLSIKYLLSQRRI